MTHPNLTHSQPQTLPIVTRLKPLPSNQWLADTTVIPVTIVGRYVGLAWEVFTINILSGQILIEIFTVGLTA